MGNYDFNAAREKFAQFTDFLNQQKNAATSTAVARQVTAIGKDGNAVTTISAERGDSVRKILRSKVDQNANNTIRKLFMETVADLFGGVGMIPKSVRDQMKLKDFDGKGRPLTARRIYAVKQAIDQFALKNVFIKDPLEADGAILNQDLDNTVDDGHVEDFKDPLKADGSILNQDLNNAVDDGHVEDVEDPLEADGSILNQNLNNAVDYGHIEDFEAKAKAAGFKEEDFAALNFAANLYSKTAEETGLKGLNDADIDVNYAMNRLLTKGCPAYNVFKRGPLYLQDTKSMYNGFKVQARLAKISKLMDTAFKQLVNAKSGSDGKPTLKQLDAMRTLIDRRLEQIELTEKELGDLVDMQDRYGVNLDAERKEMARNFKEAKSALANFKSGIGLDTTPADFYKAVTAQVKNPGALETTLKRAITAARNSGDKAVEQNIVRYYTAVTSSFAELNNATDKMVDSFRSMVAGKNVGELHTELLAAGKNTGYNPPSSAKDQMEKFISCADNPFKAISQLEGLIKDVADGVASLDIDRGTELKTALENKWGMSAKTTNVYDTLVDELKGGIFSKALQGAVLPRRNYANVKTLAGTLVDVMIANPKFIDTLDLRIKPDRLEDAKAMIKNFLHTEFKNMPVSAEKQNAFDPETGIFSLSIREYNFGYVKQNGKNLPKAAKVPRLGNKDRKSEEDDAYIETLEGMFDSKHRKMRSAVSMLCSMTNGIVGGISSIVGGINIANAKPEMRMSDKVPNDLTMETKLGMTMNQRGKIDFHDISVAKNGDVTIKLVHHRQWLLSSDLMGNAYPYSPAMPGVRFEVTVNIKAQSDDELGDNPPEFTVTEVKQSPDHLEE